MASAGIANANGQDAQRPKAHRLLITTVDATTRRGVSLRSPATDSFIDGPDRFEEAAPADGRANILPFPDMRDELANKVTHAVGLAMSIAGLFLLLFLAGRNGTAWHVVGCSIYAVSLVMLFAASTVYHSFHRKRLKDFFRTVDHVCIYLLIAGTYTPFTLTLMRGPWGWTLLGLVWSFALIGILVKVNYAGQFGVKCAVPYIATGWLAVIAAKPIAQTVSLGALLWLLAGGLFYTLGVYFWVKDGRRFFHAIWHVFVLAGGACHYCAVILYVVPVAA